MALTNTACRAAKGRQADYKLSYGGGLYLLAKPSGTRLSFRAFLRAQRRGRATSIKRSSTRSPPPQRSIDSAPAACTASPRSAVRA